MVNDDLIRAARDMLPNSEYSVASTAKLLGVSPGTLYNHIPTSPSCAPDGSTRRWSPPRRGARRQSVAASRGKQKTNIKTVTATPQACTFHFGTTYSSPAASFSWARRVSGLRMMKRTANDEKMKARA